MGVFCLQENYLRFVEIPQNRRFYDFDHLCFTAESFRFNEVRV